MGLRTILDMYMVRKVKDKGNFKQKIEKLVKLGFISAHQIQILQPIIDAGNAAAHRAYTPTSKDLTLALDVVETLLHQGILVNATSELKDRIPQRNRG